MRIGDRCFVHGYVDEIRKDTVIIKNKGGYFGTDPGEVIVVYDTTHPNWIPVTEKLPMEEMDVLVCNTNGDIAIASGAMSLGPKDSWIWHNTSQKFGKVFAWMPLPVGPYREEG